jgi:hypothetical protein
MKILVLINIKFNLPGNPNLLNQKIYGGFIKKNCSNVPGSERYECDDHGANTTRLIRNIFFTMIMAVAFTACKKNDSTKPPSATTLPLPPAPTISVQPSFFGMHLSNVTQQPWPSIDNFSAVRLWGLRVYDGIGYPSVEWKHLNPSDGVYNWTYLDAVVKSVQDHGKEIVFTLGGNNPRWASTNPDGAGCAYGNGTCYAPTIDAWKKFVTAITTRYDGNHGYGKIKYWEVWNEPNAPNFWGEVTDSYTKMVSLAQAAYPIIKAAAPDNLVISPCPQGSNAYKWLDPYFAAGGDQFTDVVAFHTYIFGSPPEKLFDFLKNINDVQAKYPALAGKPRWDTEHAWGDDFSETYTWAVNEDEQTAWVARHRIISATLGIQRSFWYMWDGYEGQPHYGWLFNRNKKILRKPGIAYNEVYNWLVNANIGTGVLTDGVYQFQVGKPGGYKGLIVWAASPTPSFTKSFTVPAGYIKYRTLDATTENTSAGSILTLTMKPILLENQ